MYSTQIFGVKKLVEIYSAESIDMYGPCGVAAKDAS